MYLCPICNTAFDRPYIHTDYEWQDGFPRPDTEESCPICASPYFEKAVLCPRCGEWMPDRGRLCRTCRGDLLRRFTDFADTLTAEEEEQLDDWLDGDTITNRRTWK